MSLVQRAEDDNATFGALTLGYTRWVTSRVWLKGGYGLGYLEIPKDKKGTFQASKPGGVFTGGFGVEMVHTRRFSVDATARFERIRYLDEPVNYASMGLSFNWFPRTPKW